MSHRIVSVSKPCSFDGTAGELQQKAARVAREIGEFLQMLAQTAEGRESAGAPDDSELLTVAEAAERLAVSRHTVYRLIAARDLEHVRVEGTIRVEPEAIFRYLERGRTLTPVQLESMRETLREDVEPAQWEKIRRAVRRIDC